MRHRHLHSRRTSTPDSNLSHFRGINAATGHSATHLAGPELNQHAKRIEKYQVAHGIAALPRDRLPLTIDILEKMAKVVNLKKPEEVRTLTFCLVGVFGLFRSGELAQAQDNPFNANLHVTRQDVTWYSTYTTIYLRTSKTDKTGRGTKVTIPRIDGYPLCPTRWLYYFLNHCATTTSGRAPILSIDGSAYTKDQATRGMRQLIKRAGCDSTK